MPRSAAKGTGRKPASGTGLLWMQGLACGVMLAFAPSSILLVAALFAPAVAVLVADTTPGRQVAKAAVLFDLAAGLHALKTVWLSDQPLVETANALHRPSILLGCWTSVALAWLGVELVAFALRLVLEANNTRHQTLLREKIAALEDEWDLAEPVPPA